MAKYDRLLAKSAGDALKRQTEEVDAQVMNLDGVIRNFSGVSTYFQGQFATNVLSFMNEVPLGANEAIRILMSETDTQYEALLKRFKTVDDADDAVITYEDLGKLAETEVDGMEKAITEFITDVNVQITIAKENEAEARALTTADYDANKKAIETKAEMLYNDFQRNKDVMSEPDALAAFIQSVNNFVGYLGSCQASTYATGDMGKQPWYSVYHGQATKILESKSDEYYVQQDSNTMGPLTLKTYVRRIETYVEEGEKTGGHSERLDHLIELAKIIGGASKVREQAALLLKMSQLSAMDYDLTGDENSAKKAKMYGVIGMILMGASERISEFDRISHDTGNPTDIKYKDSDFINIFYDESGEGRIEFTSLKRPFLENDRTSKIHGTGTYDTVYGEETIAGKYFIDSQAGGFSTTYEISEDMTGDEVKAMIDALAESTFIALTYDLVFGMVPGGETFGILTDGVDARQTQIVSNETAKKFMKGSLMSNFGFDGGHIKDSNGDVIAVVITPTVQTERMLEKYRQVTGDTNMTSDYLLTDGGIAAMNEAMSNEKSDEYKKLKKAATAAGYENDIFGYLNA